MMCYNSNYTGVSNISVISQLNASCNISGKNSFGIEINGLEKLLKK